MRDQSGGGLTEAILLVAETAPTVRRDWRRAFLIISNVCRKRIEIALLSIEIDAGDGERR